MDTRAEGCGNFKTAPVGQFTPALTSRYGRLQAIDIRVSVKRSQVPASLARSRWSPNVRHHLKQRVSPATSTCYDPVDHNIGWE
jgi:hypothetical protein